MRWVILSILMGLIVFLLLEITVCNILVLETVRYFSGG